MTLEQTLAVQCVIDVHPHLIGEREALVSETPTGEPAANRRGRHHADFLCRRHRQRAERRHGVLRATGARRVPEPPNNSEAETIEHGVSFPVGRRACWFEASDSYDRRHRRDHHVSRAVALPRLGLDVMRLPGRPLQHAPAPVPRPPRLRAVRWYGSLLRAAQQGKALFKGHWQVLWMRGESRA